MIINIVPHNDIREHTLDNRCECEPKVEVNRNGNMIVIHQSWDGREIIEEAYKIINNLKKSKEI